MRWHALGVDYEMAGKDLIDSVKLSSRIARVLGARAAGRIQLRALPRRERAEDLEDRRATASRSNEWLAYASPESLSLVHVPEADRGEAALFRRHPAQRRRLSRLSRRLSAPGVEGAARQSGLAHSCRSAARARNPDPRRGTARRSRSPCCSISPRSPTPKIRRSCGGSSAATIRWRRRKPIPVSTAWFAMRSPIFAILSPPRSAIARPTTSSAAFSSRFRRSSPSCRRTRAPTKSSTRSTTSPGRFRAIRIIRPRARPPARPGVSNDFFNMVYAVLLGEERGPRLGSFIALYGLDETRQLIDKALAGELVQS